MIIEDECENCGGEGYIEEDCFEDSCCCIDGHDVIRCPACLGTGVVRRELDQRDFDAAVRMS